MNLHFRPLFPIALAYIAGIICAAELRLSIGAGLWLGSVVTLLAAVVTGRGWSRSMRVLAGGVFLVGLIRTSAGWAIPYDDISRFAEGKLVHLTGVVASDPELREDGSMRFVLRAESVKTYTGEYRVSGRTMVTICRPRWHTDGSSTYTPFHADRVRIHARLRTPTAPANPGSGSYADYLARHRVFCAMSAPIGAVRYLGPGPGIVGRTTAWFKAALTARVRSLFPGDQGNLLLGIMLGNYVALPLSVQSAFMRTGTMHLLAASGYNCGVIVLIFRWILQRLTVPRAWMHVILILLLWVFAVLAGAGPSIIRATIMATTFLSAYLLWRAADMVNTVLLSGLVILFANPLSLYDVGFQLSFAAVLSIVLAMPIMQPWFHREPEQDTKLPTNRLWRPVTWSLRSILDAVLLSVAAMVGTLPITAVYFNYLSTVSILANALVALLVVALTACGLVAVAFSGIPLIGPLAVSAGQSVSGSMLYIVTALGELPWAALSVRSPMWVFVLFYYVVALGALECLHRITSHKRVSTNGKIPEQVSA